MSGTWHRLSRSVIESADDSTCWVPTLATAFATLCWQWNTVDSHVEFQDGQILSSLERYGYYCEKRRSYEKYWLFCNRLLVGAAPTESEFLGHYWQEFPFPKISNMWMGGRRCVYLSGLRNARMEGHARRDYYGMQESRKLIQIRLLKSKSWS